jgi:tRNA-Thr(GGU) m(6)t(6)A37 methyltransferase TsaA
MELGFHPIGKIVSPFKTPEGMPIQSAAAKGVKGEIILLPEYVPGIQDLEGFSHIILLYYFHKIRESKLIVKPFLDDQPRGVFATRAPQRPNPIGLSVVRLIKIEGGTLYVENLDILDGTPLLDIKPYVPMIDEHGAASIGWLGDNKNSLEATKSDNRFVGD